MGVIGSGGIARRRTIPEGIMTARTPRWPPCTHTNAVTNAEVAAQFNAEPAGNLDALLNNGIDAVYVATPPGLHYEQVLECARAGKHVLCEKPLGMTVDEAGSMIAACRKAGVELGTAFMMRLLSQHQAALKLIEEGRLGRPTYGRAQLSCWYPPIKGAWRQDPATGGGGSLIDMGGHCIDLLEMFFGPVRRVSCFINNTVHDYTSEDSAVAMLRFENGALGTVDTFFCMPDESSKNVLELYGSKVRSWLRGTIGQGQAGQMTACLNMEAADYNAQQGRSAGQAVPIAPQPVNTYRTDRGFQPGAAGGSLLCAQRRGGTAQPDSACRLL